MMLSCKFTRSFHAPRILRSCISLGGNDNNLASDPPTDQSNGKGKRKKTSDKRRLTANLVEPMLELERRKEIQSVVGIHLGPKSLYWAQINRDGEILEWKTADLFPTVEVGRKMQLPKIFAAMDCISEKIPFSDIFVLEAPNKGLLSSVSSPAVVANAIFQSQIIAILLTILNLRLENEDNSEEYYHKVFLMKPRIVSRFFNLLVGTERVSALRLVDLILRDKDSPSVSISEIMDENEKDKGVSNVNPEVSVKHSSPMYTPVKASSSLIEYYRALEAVEREAMSQALLITMAFYDLVVIKDPKILAPFEGKSIVSNARQRS